MAGWSIDWATASHPPWPQHVEEFRLAVEERAEAIGGEGLAVDGIDEFVTGDVVQYFGYDRWSNEGWLRLMQKWVENNLGHFVKYDPTGPSVYDGQMTLPHYANLGEVFAAAGLPYATWRRWTDRNTQTTGKATHEDVMTAGLLADLQAALNALVWIDPANVAAANYYRVWWAALGYPAPTNVKGGWGEDESWAVAKAEAIADWTASSSTQRYTSPRKGSSLDWAVGEPEAALWNVYNYGVVEQTPDVGDYITIATSAPFGDLAQPPWPSNTPSQGNYEVRGYYAEDDVWAVLRHDAAQAAVAFYAKSDKTNSVTEWDGFGHWPDPYTSLALYLFDTVASGTWNGFTYY